MAIHDQLKPSDADIAAYVAETDEPVEIHFYAVEQVGDGHGFIPVSDELSQEIPEAEYRVRVESDDSVYDEPIDTAFDSVDQLGEDYTVDDVAAWLDDEQVSYTLHHPSDRAADELVATVSDDARRAEKDFYNPFDCLRYLGEQVSAAEETADELRDQLEQYEEQELRKRTITAYTAPIASLVGQSLLASWRLAEGDTDSALLLTGSGIATYPYISAAAGDYLKHVRDNETYRPENGQ